jgi:hypothetical protein
MLRKLGLVMPMERSLGLEALRPVYLYRVETIVCNRL